MTLKGFLSGLKIQMILGDKKGFEMKYLEFILR